MHDSLTSKIFQRLGQKHTEVRGIALNMHSLGFHGVESKQASLLPSLSPPSTIRKTLHFQHFSKYILCTVVIRFINFIRQVISLGNYLT